MTQRVLVTAGASGIGMEIARAFVGNAAKVCICDIDVKALETAKNAIPGLLTTVCDVSKRQDIERMVATAAEVLGGLDVLVNNAGISGPTAPVEEMDPDAWEKVMQVNLTGTFNVTRLAIPHLKKSSAGVIINMSSAAGRFGYPNRSPYCAAKWGVIGFTKTLSIELGAFGIRANALLPGAVGGARIEHIRPVTLDYAKPSLVTGCWGSIPAVDTFSEQRIRRSFKSKRVDCRIVQHTRRHTIPWIHPEIARPVCLVAASANELNL